ncbi:MAG: hypothetical protein ABSA59_23650 [Terriglobia bacterium]|jgi:hypothetical protein
MKWVRIVTVIWYWWRLYSLSFNTSGFPDPKYAEGVWLRKWNHSFFLGADGFHSLDAPVPAR